MCLAPQQESTIAIHGFITDSALFSQTQILQPEQGLEPKGEKARKGIQTPTSLGETLTISRCFLEHTVKTEPNQPNYFPNRSNFG